MRGTGRNLVIPAVLAALALPPTTSAQEPGVNVDPESPAGKEYGIPLEQARRGAGAPAGPTGDTAAFGAGITSRDDDEAPPGNRTGGSTPSASAADSDSAGVAQGSRGAGTESAPSPPSARPLTDTGGAPAGLLTALITLGVLAGGAALGAGLRRLRLR